MFHFKGKVLKTYNLIPPNYQYNELRNKISRGIFIYAPLLLKFQYISIFIYIFGVNTKTSLLLLFTNLLFLLYALYFVNI